MADEKKRDDDYTIDMGREKSPSPIPRASAPSSHHFSIENHPVIAVLAYCGSSILMIVTNKVVLSGRDYNLNFLLLAVQVCLPSAAASRLTPTNMLLVRRLRNRNRIPQARQHNHLPRLQHRRSEEMVSHLAAPNWHDLYLHLGHQIPLHPRLHNLQKPDYNPNRLRRSVVVRRHGNDHGALLLRPHGSLLHRRSLGRHPPRPRIVRRRNSRRTRSHLHAERRLLLDADQLSLHRSLHPLHAQAHQANQLQRLR